MNELELERLAKTLGDRAAERLNVEATARAVVERLRDAPAARRVTWIRPEWLRIAAALALLLGAGVALQRITSPSRPVEVHYTLADLGDLTAAELTEVLVNIERTLADESNGATAGDLDELTPAQLQVLLRSLET